VPDRDALAGGGDLVVLVTALGLVLVAARVGVRLQYIPLTPSFGNWYLFQKYTILKLNYNTKGFDVLNNLYKQFVL